MRTILSLALFGFLSACVFAQPEKPVAYRATVRLKQEIPPGYPYQPLTLDQHLIRLGSAEYKKSFLSSFPSTERVLVEDRSRTPRDNSPRLLDHVLRSSLIVQKSSEPRTIAVIATHLDSDVARLFANRYARQYVSYSMDISRPKNPAAQEVANYLGTEPNDLVILNVASVEALQALP